MASSAYGCYFEDLEPGQKFRHWPGRTITEFDDTLFSLLSMNQHPVHIDEHFASGTQHGQRLVEGPIVISLVIGMSQARHRRPRHGNPGVLGYSPCGAGVSWRYHLCRINGAWKSVTTGMVTLEHRGLNQRGELVLTMSRKIVVPRRLASPQISSLRADKRGVGKILVACGIILCVWAGALQAQTVTTTPGTLTFTYQEGAATLPKAQSVAVKPSTGKPTFTTSTPPTDYWLTVNMDSGVLPASISVEVNPTSLAVGTYTSVGDHNSFRCSIARGGHGKAGNYFSAFYFELEHE